METLIRTVIATVLAFIFSLAYVWIFTSWLGYPNPSRWEQNILFFALLIHLMHKHEN